MLFLDELGDLVDTRVFFFFSRHAPRSDSKKGFYWVNSEIIGQCFFFFFYQKQICLFFKKMFLSVDMIELIGFDRVNIFLV